MRLLRLRILCLLLAQGLIPLALLLAGVYWLPAGLLTVIWFGLLVLGATAFAAGISGHLARPVRDLAMAFDHMLRTQGGPAPHCRAVPQEFGRVQRAFSLFLTDHQRQLAAASDEARQCRQKLQDSGRLIQRSFGIIQGVFHASGDGILVQDRAGQVIASNEALDRLLGRPVEQVAGRDGSRLLACIASLLKDARPFEALIEKTGDDQDYEGRVEIAASSGEAGMICIHTCPFHAEGGAVLGRVWMVQESTARRYVSGQLHQSQKMEAIGQLAGGIAHDFNNLLTAIRGNLALAELSQADKPEVAREQLQGAARATDRATELVKQLLGYSRKTAAMPKPTDVNGLVAEVANILRHSIDPRITLHCDLNQDLWLAQADPVNIEQVILNLALNARDAMPESGGRIDISTGNVAFDERRMPPPDVDTGATEFVCIRVRDDGCGIPEDERGRIFDPFFSTKAPGKGTGLGLVTVKDIVHEHGGWIEFDSEEGKGTEFRVYLPRAAALATAPGGTERVENKPVPARNFGASGKTGAVLIVDDEDSVRSVAVTMLGHLGYKVEQAADGEQALEKIASAHTPFDAILLDIFMPKLSGRDTFKRLRAMGCATPVIVCSGFAIEPEEFAALGGPGGGPAGIIQKPYSMESLSGAVADAIASGQVGLVA